MVWHPFLLNPHLPPRGVTRLQYLERRFGSVAQAQGVHRRVVQAGAREGIPFAFGAIRAQPNTVPAHAPGAGGGRARPADGDGGGPVSRLLRDRRQYRRACRADRGSPQSSGSMPRRTRHVPAIIGGGAGDRRARASLRAGHRRRAGLRAGGGSRDRRRAAGRGAGGASGSGALSAGLAGHGAAVRGAKPRSRP